MWQVLSLLLAVNWWRSSGDLYELRREEEDREEKSAAFSLSLPKEETAGRSRAHNICIKPLHCMDHKSGQFHYVPLDFLVNQVLMLEQGVYMSLREFCFWIFIVLLHFLTSVSSQNVSKTANFSVLQRLRKYILIFQF